ncbi:protein fuzzy homolog [Esox lucius]|uniref:Fuzzy planar cell polarity protein n=1 Tax=Esox lucius TaxID=8010 RepID=A0AAY5KKC4_ESOLU|nr:protein fuzzy homolog [Esox lucius]XP_010885009.2 protein fuzzy homolog [Esox lucius]
MMLQQTGSVQLLCLTANSGVPLFTRGACKQLPFSIIGSLNGVHMFGAGQGVVLGGCETDRGGRVVWRVFQDSVMLIAVSAGRHAQQGSGSGDSGEGDFQMRRLLENVWSCMVLVLGQDELVSVRNVERLKRDLRSCYRLIDQLLEGVQGQQSTMGDLTHCGDCLLPTNPALLQEALDGFTQAAESEFGCLMVHGRIAAATDKWWRLAPQEVVLLSALARTLSGSASCDFPVFLPQGSPNVAHRLLRFQLLLGADVCVLCGPSPTLNRAESELVGRFWSPVVEALRGTLAVGERCLPGSVTLRPDVLAVLLINRESRRSVSCVKTVSAHPSPHPCSPPLPSKTRCWELLRLFFTFSATRYFPLEETPPTLALTPGQNGHGEDTESLQEDFVLGFFHQPLQCYLVTDECKCYGLQTGQHQLYLLTPLSVPTFALRSVATETLSALTAAKGF